MSPTSESDIRNLPIRKDLVTGIDVGGTKVHWSTFDPRRPTSTYGIEFETALDVVTIAAGMLQETDADLLALKSRTPTRTGTKLVVTTSTGVGTTAAVWDSRSNRYLAIDGLGGHAGFQPKNDEEHRYLRYLFRHNPRASVERALSGKHGINNMIAHTLESIKAPRLAAAVESMRAEHGHTGAVLLEFATKDDGADGETAQGMLRTLGAMLGSASPS